MQRKSALDARDDTPDHMSIPPRKTGHLRKGEMYGFRWTLIAIFFALSFWSSALRADQSDTVQILGARIGVHKSHTRLVLDLTANVSFKPIEGDAPDRIVIDLPNTSLKKGAPFPRGGQGVIEHSMVVGEGVEHSRLILFTKTPAKIKKAFIIPPAGAQKNYRLVIDIVPVAKGAEPLRKITRPEKGA